MNVTIDITRSEGLKALLQRARNLPAETLQALGKALTASGHTIVGNAVKDRFTGLKGPFPVSEHRLGATVQKPRLRLSITNTPPQIREGESAVTMGFGSNVRYFGVHEFGFSGSVPVRAHQRLGRPVRAHSRFVKIPARAPMQTELRSERTEELIMKNARIALTRMLNTMTGGAA